MHVIHAHDNKNNGGNFHAYDLLKSDFKLTYLRNLNQKSKNRG